MWRAILLEQLWIRSIVSLAKLATFFVKWTHCLGCMTFGGKSSFHLENCLLKIWQWRLFSSECTLILTPERDSMTDRIERIQRLFRLEVMITTWGIQDSASMISKVFIGTKVVPSRRDLRWFSISGHTRTSKICSWSQSQQYVMWYIKVCLLWYSS